LLPLALIAYKINRLIPTNRESKLNILNL